MSMYFSCTLSKHTIHLFRESTRTIEASNGASLPSNRPTLCPFTAVSPHASQFSWVAPHTSHLPNMEQWHRRTRYAMLLRSMVDNQQSSHAKSINLSKIHQAFATTSDLLFAYAMPWYGHQQPTAILWTSCYSSSQSRLSSLAHWLIVEGEPLQGLQRIGRSWHLPRVDQVSSGHLP